MVQVACSWHSPFSPSAQGSTGEHSKPSPEKPLKHVQLTFSPFWLHLASLEQPPFQNLHILAAAEEVRVSGWFTFVLSSILLLRSSCMYLCRWYHLLHRRVYRHRCYSPCRRPSHGKSDCRQDRQLKHQKCMKWTYRYKAMLVFSSMVYNPKTK